MNRITHLALALGIVGLLALVVALAAGTQPPALADSTSATIWKVPDDYATIQAAIDAAADGDTILVAENLAYYEENLSISKGITLSGGWTTDFMTRHLGAHVTTIDGRGMGRVISITCASSATVVTIDGFTILRGDATGQGGPMLVGGAVSGTAPSRSAPAPPGTDAASPSQDAAQLRAGLADLVARGLYPGGEAAYRSMLARLDRVTVLAEQARARAQSVPARDRSKQGADYGGGVYSWNASLRLLNCYIEDNHASTAGDGYGGGVFVGQAADGGVRIANNTVEKNVASASAHDLAQGWGGGVYVLQAPGAHVEDNVLRQNVGNEAGYLSLGIGGGLVVDHCPWAIVRRNTAERNVASSAWEAYDALAGGAYFRAIDDGMVSQNVFRDNQAALRGMGRGGGFYLYHADHVLIDGNTVVGNWACLYQATGDVNGGGLGVDTVSNSAVVSNTIQENTACVYGWLVSYGGGFYGYRWEDHTVLVANTISGNIASPRAGGMGGGGYLESSIGAVIGDNAFVDNVGSLLDEHSGNGGGLYLRNTVGNLVKHNRFQGNRASTNGPGEGGALAVASWGPFSFDTTVDGNLFLDNRANVNPAIPSIGGACIVGTDGFTFTNNVVAGNTANQGGGLALENAQRGVVVNNTLVGNGDTGVLVDQFNRTPITLTNNAIVSHTVGISVSAGATATVRYTLWHGNGTDVAGAGAISHTHPVTGPPGFVDPATHDYHLTAGSAARDTGDPAGVPPAPPADRDGVPRPQGLGVDIGAYEWLTGYQIYLPLAFRQWLPAVGWAVGDPVDGYGTILHTTDGGASWARQGTTQTIPNAYLHAVSAVDAANAWVVGGNVILRTRDGGQTWEQQPLPAGVPTTTTLTSVKTIDGNTAWAVGSPDVLLQTTDGQTWSVMPRNADLYLPWSVTYGDVDAADATHVWAVGGTGATGAGEAVIAFYDGVQWHRQGTGVIPIDTDNGLIGVSVLDQDTVWAVGGWSLPLVKTTDGGASWQPVGPVLSSGDINRVVAVNANVGWVAGDFGTIKRTDDGGQSWAKQPGGAGVYLYTISAAGTYLAWAVGPSETGRGAGCLLRTLDGQHWEKQAPPVAAGLWGVSFVGARR